MKDLEKEKLQNVIDFYMLANNLKYIMNDNDQSVADQIYGSMILATAIQSEYNRMDNLGKSIKIILLGIIDKYYHKELISTLDKMPKGKENLTELFQYYDSTNLNNKNERIAFHCIQAELSMTYFFDQFLLEEEIQISTIEELYKLAKNYGFIDQFGNDDKKNFKIFRFYYLNRVLKKKIRSGWDATHWNIDSDRIERISEHIVGTIALAIALDSEFEFHIALEEVISVLCIHEVGEINIGDITPFDGITPKEKEEIEHRAVIQIIGDLSKGRDMIRSIFEFDKKETKESKFAHYCDKLEADIQAKVYQDMGCQHALSEQQNNVVFQSKKVQKMLQDGASNAFDIWYEWDKPIYTNEPIFTKTLKYIKDTKLK